MSLMYVGRACCSHLTIEMTLLIRPEIVEAMVIVSVRNVCGTKQQWLNQIGFYILHLGRGLDISSC